MYNIVYETSRQSRFDARYWVLGAGALVRPRGMVWGGRREKGSGWGTRVYLKKKKKKKATKQLNSLVLLFHCILLCFTTFYGNFERHITFDLKKFTVCPESQTKLQPVFEK